MFEHPFLLPDHAGYAEILTDAAVHVLEVRGVAQFSVAAMARWMKVSPESIHNLYSRATVIDLVTVRFARRWLWWSAGDPRWARGRPLLPLQLPRTAEERHGVRVLHALEELARGEQVQGNPLPSQRLSRMRDEEVELLRSRLAHLGAGDPAGEPPMFRIAGLMALADGLRSTLARTPAGLTWDAAAEVLSDAVSATLRPGRGGPTTTPDLPPPHEPAA